MQHLEMPAGEGKSSIYTRPFRVRWQECDGFGVVNTVNYLYYMQETAMAHSVELGYTADRWLDRRIAWVIRETELEYLKPLKFGDTVVVSLWMGDLRRMSAARFYELHLEGTQELIARARSEWVGIDLDRMRPIPIPQDVVDAFFGEGHSAKPSTRKRFPKSPPRPKQVFRTYKTVEWRDLDLQQHVNNATYLSYMETAGQKALEELGVSVQSLLERNVGAWLQWSHVLYQGQAAVSDELEIVAYVSNLGKTSYIGHYEIVRVEDGAILTRGQSRWVWVDLISQRPIPIPADLRSGLRPYSA